MKRIICLVSILAVLLCACGKGVSKPSWQEQYDLGVRYLTEGNYEEAIIAFTAAIEIDSKKADAYLKLAQVYTAQDDSEKALDILKKAVDSVGTTENSSAELLSDGRFRFLDRDSAGNVRFDIYFDANGVLREEFHYEKGRLVKECSYYDDRGWNPDIHEFIYNGNEVTILLSLADANGTASSSFIYVMASEKNSIYLDGWGGDTAIGQITYLSVTEVTPEGVEVATTVLVDQQLGGASTANETEFGRILRSGNSGKSFSASDISFFGVPADEVPFETMNQDIVKNALSSAGWGFWGSGNNEISFHARISQLTYPHFNATFDRDNDFLLESWGLSGVENQNIENVRQFEKVNVGIADICLNDSFDVVLNKLGFENSSEIEEYLGPNSHQMVGSSNAHRYEGNGFALEIYIDEDSENLRLRLLIPSTSGIREYRLRFYFGSENELVDYSVYIGKR